MGSKLTGSRFTARQLIRCRKRWRPTIKKNLRRLRRRRRAAGSEVDLSQPTVSHHRKVLVDAGLLTREQRGKWAYFRVVPDSLAAPGSLLSTD